MDRDNLIRSYFLQGFTNAEIGGFLALQHGIILCVRTVKWILKRLRLRRAGRNSESPLEQIVFAIVEELENSCGSFMGYHQLTRRLRRKYNLQVRRDTVMKSLCIIDPEGVECRKKRRLKRQRYITPGPNYLWHVDGWDKFGIFIHGAVDGFSRRILWLEANSTNKNPSIIASHYLMQYSAATEGGSCKDALRQGHGEHYHGTSTTVFRWHDDDDFAGSKSFVQGKSSGNQRIEAWWSKFREGGGDWWINLFKDLHDFKFCFLPVLRQELYLVAELWNMHNIQAQTRLEVHGGKPDMMYCTPEVYNSHNYLIPVDMDDVSACKGLYAENCPDHADGVEESVQLIKPDYVPPSNANEALKLYCEITDVLKNY